MMKFVPLFLTGTIVQLALSAVVKTPIYRISAGRVAKTAKSTAPPSQRTAYYHTDISIGTPPQSFTTWIMATISYAWVPDVSCKCPALCRPSSIACQANFCDIDSECCDAGFDGTDAGERRGKGTQLKAPLHPFMAGVGTGLCNPKRTLFQSSSSSTYTSDGTPFDDTDADTTDIRSIVSGAHRPQGSGFMGVDTVTLGSLVVKNAMFGQGQKIALQVGYDESIDGVLGLGPSAANPRGIESAVVTAFKQGLIDQPVAALWLNKSAKHYGSGRTVHGEITYGGVDDEKCGPVSRYHDISASADQYGVGWFVLADVTLGNATLRQVQVQFDFSSGVSGLFGDVDYQNRLLNGIGAFRNLFDCNLKFNLTVTIDDVDYVVPSDAVVSPESVTGGPPTGDCELDFDEYGGNGQLVLGEFFLKQYCHSFDIGNSRIGFGKNLAQ